MSSSSLGNLTALQTCQSNEDNRPSIHRPPCHTHRGCHQMSCFRADKSIAKRLLSTCLRYWEKSDVPKRLSRSVKPDLSHCCRSRFLPLTKIELSSHVNDGGSSSQSIFNCIGQCVSLCHQSTAENSSDSRRTPTQRMNKHPFSVQCVTWCQ